MRGWYVINCGVFVKIVRVDDHGDDFCVGELPVGTSIGLLTDFVFDTGAVEDGDLLVLPDGSQVRLDMKSSPQ